MAMTRRQPCIVGPGAGARKYDLLTWIAVAGLHDRALSPVLALRLIALVTARYNWALDMASVGHEELARLWGVSRRTVIRDIEKLRAAGLIAVARPARRGRVAAYRLDQAAFAALAAPLGGALAPDLAARIAVAGQGPEAAADGAPDGAAKAAGQGAAPNVVALFPGAAACADPDHALWRRILAEMAGFAAPVALERWLAPLVCEGLRDGVMALRAPSPFHASYVNRTYGERLGRIAAALGPLKLRIRGQAPSRSGEAPI